MKSKSSGCFSRVLSFIGYALFLSIGVGLIWSATIAGWAIKAGYASLSKELQVALGAGMLTIIGSVLSLIVSNRVNSKEKVRQSLYEKKQPVYEKLLGFIFKLMKETKNDIPTSEDEMFEFMMDFSKELMLWGSDDVIKSYVSWRRVAGSNPEPKQILLSLEELFLSIRADFGHKNKGIQKGDLLSFILIDSDEILKDDAPSTNQSNL